MILPGQLPPDGGVIVKEASVLLPPKLDELVAVSVPAPLLVIRRIDAHAAVDAEPTETVAILFRGSEGCIPDGKLEVPLITKAPDIVAVCP